MLQRLADETELRRKDAEEDEEIEEDMGSPWMRFTTETSVGDGVVYWFNFKIRKLFTDPQYKHVLELELEERAAQSHKKQVNFLILRESDVLLQKFQIASWI